MDLRPTKPNAPDSYITFAYLEPSLRNQPIDQHMGNLNTAMFRIEVATYRTGQYFDSLFSCSLFNNNVMTSYKTNINEDFSSTKILITINDLAKPRGNGKMRNLLQPNWYFEPKRLMYFTTYPYQLNLKEELGIDNWHYLTDLIIKIFKPKEVFKLNYAFKLDNSGYYYDAFFNRTKDLFGAPFKSIPSLQMMFDCLNMTVMNKFYSESEVIHV